jgi:nucleoside-diphosphate-sugar epimerase
VEALVFDGAEGTVSDALAARIAEATHWLVSVPPDERGDPVLRAVQSAGVAPEAVRWVGLLSTTGMFGDRGGAWVDEETPPTPLTPRGHRRLRAEAGWAEWADARGVGLQVFRLAGIYGPGRSAFDRLSRPGSRRIVKEGSVFNRIHVDDAVGAIEAGLANPERFGVFHVADDEPASSYAVLTWAAERIGVEPPPEVEYAAADLSPMARSFYEQDYRVSNARLREVLGWRPRYPSFREGLDAILATSPPRESRTAEEGRRTHRPR